MKKLLLILLGFFYSIHIFATWSPYGPEEIIALNICFAVDNEAHTAICHSEGIYIYDNSDETWTNYESILPVLDALYLNGTDILLIMGCGSNSDGIYSFNPANEQFNLIEFLDSPNFLYYDDVNETYFAGHYSGLVTSTDGLTWTAVDTFNNKNIVTMDSYQNHYAVSQMDNIYGIYYSDNAGDTWTQSGSSDMLSCLEFDANGKLYGVFPDESWSSGLYSSPDYGQSWELEFWSININCVGFDAVSNVYIGWKENPNSSEKGIARFDQGNDTLIFINEGITNLVINEICINPAMSAIALFCCTDTGAFVTYDPTGIDEMFQIEKANHLNIKPNPANDILNIEYQLPESVQKADLIIYSTNGKRIKKYSLSNSSGKFKINCATYASGIYFICLKGPGFMASQKVIVKGE